MALYLCFFFFLLILLSRKNAFYFATKAAHLVQRHNSVSLSTCVLVGHGEPRVGKPRSKTQLRFLEYLRSCWARRTKGGQGDNSTTTCLRAACIHGERLHNSQTTGLPRFAFRSALRLKRRYQPRCSWLPPLDIRVQLRLARYT